MQWRNMFGNNVDHATIANFQSAADKQRTRTSRNFAIASPTPNRTDHIDMPCLVFQVDERDALCGHWSLTMRHRSGNQYFLVASRTALRKLHCSSNTHAFKFNAQELCWVTTR
jgi:hypothetical protein